MVRDAVSADSLFAAIDHEVFLVTTRYRGRDAGQIATWIMPATLVPDRPRLVAIFSPSNFTYELIRKSKRFVAHLLADDQYQLVSRFGLTSSRDVDKFDGVSIARTKSGLPLIAGACAYAECRWLAELDSGDRRVVLADIIVQCGDATKKPLRKNAAFQKLPPAEVQALANKRTHDGNRDRQCIKRFRAAR